MKFAPFVAALLLVAAPALAGDRGLEVGAWYVWLDPSSEGTFTTGTPEEEFDVKFDSDTGYGLSVNLFLGNRFSTEIAVSQVDMPIALEARGRAANLQPRKTSVIPVTGTIQFHLAPDAMVDPYIGAGAMYILFGDLSEGEAGNLSVDEVESDDIGYLINAGLSIELTESLGLMIDAKYMPTDTSARGLLNDANGTETDIRLSPIIISAGLAYRF